MKKINSFPFLLTINPLNNRNILSILFENDKEGLRMDYKIGYRVDTFIINIRDKK